MGSMAREIETNLSYFQLGGEGRTETLVSLSIFLPASSVLRLSRRRSSSRMGSVLSPSEGVSIALSSHLRARLLPFSLPIHLHAFFFLPRIQSRFNRVADLKPSPFPLSLVLSHTHQSASLSVPSAPRRTNSAAESYSNSTSSPPSHSRSNSSNAIPSASNPFASPKEKKDATKKEEKKKSSRHADIIDKLDPSGFWGTGSESGLSLSLPPLLNDPSGSDLNRIRTLSTS